MPLYTDFEIMTRDIIGYLRSTGQRDLLPADNPDRATMGYCTAEDPPVIWEISIIGLQVPAGPIREALQTRTGRIALAASLVGAAANMGTVNAPDEIARLTDVPGRLGLRGEPGVVTAPLSGIQNPCGEIELHENEESQRTVYDRLLDDD